jgi:catechol 2,3-dioxygenase-like lactoylglutathione lyase family enzyme
MNTPLAPETRLRIARPVRDLARALAQYRDGLGLQLLTQFEGHAGFDGAMLGLPGAAWHLEFTVCHHHPVTPAPSAEDQLVFYLPDEAAWAARCAALRAAGFTDVAAFNPWWARCGCSFQDEDGYRVVIAKAAWVL